MRITNPIPHIVNAWRQRTLRQQLNTFDPAFLQEGGFDFIRLYGGGDNHNIRYTILLHTPDGQAYMQQIGKKGEKNSQDILSNEALAYVTEKKFPLYAEELKRLDSKASRAMVK